MNVLGDANEDGQNSERDADGIGDAETCHKDGKQDSVVWGVSIDSDKRASDEQFDIERRSQLVAEEFYHYEL